MVNSEVVRYVREQIKAGFSKEEIEYALLDSGYTTAEVSEVMGYAQGGPARPQPPRPQPARVQRPQPFRPQGPPNAQPAPQPQGPQPGRKLKFGFIISFIAGLFLLANMAIVLATGNLDIMPRLGMLFDMGIENLILAMTNIILGAAMLLAALFIHKKPGKETVFGVMVIVLAVVSFASMGSFVIGTIIGLAGGVVTILKK
ncbi:MAG: hypothetical protein HY518_04750 [Candidatus Aenigmarchaeota archaeon]|nr:hypothetical protein [Candidatus Aenigmarchaeota archaeon]